MDEMDGVEPIGPIQREAMAKLVREGPIQIHQRVKRAIIDACPDFASSWAPGYVADLVIEGKLPEPAVAKVLNRYHDRIRLGHAGELPPIRVPADYLAVVFRDELSRYGLPWRKPERRSEQA